MHQAGIKHATGEAIYCDDIRAMDEELFLALVTSSRAHAKIVSIDASEALKMSGVVDIISVQDVPATNEFYNYDVPDIVFAREKVTCVGQVVCAVVADSDVHAKQATAKVKIEYEPQEPVILTIEEAIQHNSFFEPKRKLEQGNVDEAFKAVDHILEGEFHIGGQSHFYMETQSVLVVPKGEDKEMDVYTSTQHPAYVQEMVASCLGIPDNRIMCHVKRIGGAFGGKLQKTSLLACIAAVAANKTGHAVRCILDRGTDMLTTGGRHPFFGKYKVAEIMLLKMDNAYKVPNIRCHAHVCKTNLPSNTAFRGFGFPQGGLFTEVWMTRIAARCGLLPTQIRELNMYKENERTPYKQELKPENLLRCWNKCMEKSAYHTRRAAVEEFNKQNYWKKKGLAIIPMKFPVGFVTRFLSQAAALVHLYTDGSVLLTYGGVEMGQGLHTKMIQIASRELQMPMSNIHFCETSTTTVPNACGSVGSMGTDVNGMAVKDACQTLLKRLEPIISQNPKGTWKEWARKNRENRLRRLLWDRALLQSDPLVSAPKLVSSSVVPPSRPSDEGVSTMGDRPASSPKKKHEKWKHTGSNKPSDHKKAKKDKTGKLPRKTKNPECPKHRDSGSLFPSVPTAVTVPTPLGPALQAAMKVTPLGSPRHMAELTSEPLPVPPRESISDGEIRDSPSRARSPTPMPPATLEAGMEMSPPRSCRSHSFERGSEGWYHPHHPYYHGWGDSHSVGHYPAPRGHSSPPAPHDRPTPSVPRRASLIPTRESSRSLSPAESSSLAPPYYGIDSNDSEVDSTSPVISQGPGSPDESHISFAELMLHLVQSLEMDAIQSPGPSTDKFYDVVHREQSTSIVLPLITTLRQAMTQPWDLPAHPQPTSQRYESMYQVREEDIPFLLRHPKPNLVVVESSQGREARGSSRDKEGRKIDSLARRVYAASGLRLRISNYEATLVRYEYFIMQCLNNVVSALPDYQGNLAKVFIKEAMQVMVQQLSTARHHVDTDSRALVGAVSLQRHAWLRNCNFPEETNRQIEEMPFDGSRLFHSRTNHKLKKIHESHMTAWQMELQPQTRHLRTQGAWNRRESKNHINFLELLALRSFEDVLCQRVVQITSDNVATVFYLNKQGGTKSPTLARLAMQIWKWCIPRDITLVAVHLAGTDNVEVDLLSRHMSTFHEWELDPQTCDHLFHRWGFPDIDLFATRQNRAKDAFEQSINLSVTGYFRGYEANMDWEKGEGHPFEYFIYGAACTEVEIDCLTGDHKNIKTDIVMDIGRSINPAVDIGQIEGAFVQGIGLYTMEELKFSPEGVLCTRGPDQYKIPAVCDIPEHFSVSLLTSSQQTTAIYSSKGLGESALFLGCSVFFAIWDAVAAVRKERGLSADFKLNSPLTSERIRMACTDQFTAMIAKDENKPLE
ncbi:Aldehyde oxidase 1 [Varanus komodoensis]|nr:Aldehyde oxidase 1 [Varanus komodoensis]